MNKIKVILFLMVVLILTGCNSHSTVRVPYYHNVDSFTFVNDELVELKTHERSLIEKPNCPLRIPPVTVVEVGRCESMVGRVVIQNGHNLDEIIIKDNKPGEVKSHLRTPLEQPNTPYTRPEIVFREEDGEIHYK